MKKKSIGILGGMGPLATADLLAKITKFTRASADADHIRVYIDSNPAIPDRTAALLHGGNDPVPEMTAALRNLEKCGADCIIMPCNTAHAFLPRLEELTNIPFLNMIEITAKRCSMLYPGKTACLLSTTGTISARLYDEVMEKYQVRCMIPNEQEMETLMYLIYDVVKASKPLEPEAERWNALLSGLQDEGADYFILACTELPILADTLGIPCPFIDPTIELAKAAVEYCGYPVNNY